MRLICSMALLMSLLTQTVFGATPKDMLVVLKNIDDIVSLDPAESYEFSGAELLANIYQNLVQYDPADPNHVRPGLATRWSAGKDGHSIEFFLNPDARFASENGVRADDVVYSFRRVVHLNRAPAFILTQLGWTDANFDEMVKKTGDRTLTVLWKGDLSAGFVLNLLASRPASIVDEKVVATHETSGDLGNTWLQQHSAGSGSYQLKLYKPREVVVLEAVSTSSAGAPKIKQLLFKNVTDGSTQRLQLESGDADIARDLGPDQVAALKAGKDITVEAFPQATVHFLSLNQKSEKLRNPAVWEALRYLVDYDAIANQLLAGQMVVHQAFLPSGFAGALNENPYKYDPAKAREILMKAGIKNLSIDVDLVNTPRFLNMAQSMQASMAKGGVTLNLLPGTAAQVITRYRARKQEAILFYWRPDYFDPHSNGKAFAYNVDNSDTAPQSSATWRNAWLVPDLSAKTMTALAEYDADKRAADYREIQRIVQKNSPIIVTFQEASQVAVRSNVKGFKVGPTPDLIWYAGVSK